ncbi:MAG: RNA-binding protein [Candidatus Omnitrophica bacterium]|nr:RNA-binding protein [Candidatus Omnitrophota bacterium]MDD5440808.1 RNA-binding protein [Candidatus Omnitrophota bacterium]
MNIYVGNLSFNAKEDEVRELFAQYGEVSAVRIISDKFSGRSKGFCFVDMPTNDQAQKAVDELNGKEFLGRELRVNEARPKEDKPRREFK